MEYLCIWFGAFGTVILTIYLWRFVVRLSSPETKTLADAPPKVDSERQKQELEKRQAEEREKEAAQGRRDEAKAACEWLFALHAPELKNRFTREMFDDFVHRHFGDHKMPEYVERRAAELCDIVR